jgi:hypothetical protein
MRERAEAEARKKRLESLAGKENELWATVDRLVATKQSRRYDEAVSLLQDLHDLAERQRKGPDFKLRLGALQRENSGKSSLMERFREQSSWEESCDAVCAIEAVKRTLHSGFLSSLQI